MPVSEALRQQIAQTYPWMNDEMLSAYLTSWGQYEDQALAVRAVRTTAAYRTVFAGNYDSTTGEVRMSESDYFASKASFDATLAGMGVNPSYFQDEWIMALEGEVSPAEMRSRMESAYERISQSAPEIRRFYADTYGIDLTDSAILASALSPRIGELILNRQIAVAEIGGSAAQRGFNITADFAKQLAEHGLGRGESEQFFGQASELIPAMEILSARHSDPDDPFDLNDVSAAFLFDDPETRRRIRRVFAQEASAFTGSANDMARDQRTGGVVGLGTR